LRRHLLNQVEAYVRIREGLGVKFPGSLDAPGKTGVPTAIANVTALLFFLQLVFRFDSYRCRYNCPAVYWRIECTLGIYLLPF
jgi:hypothetical protein